MPRWPDKKKKLKEDPSIAAKQPAWTPPAAEMPQVDRRSASERWLAACTELEQAANRCLQDGLVVAVGIELRKEACEREPQYIVHGKLERGVQTVVDTYSDQRIRVPGRPPY